MKRRPIYIPFAGPALLEAPLLNKGSAFTLQERQQFNIEGLLPYSIETIVEQAARCYHQFSALDSDLDKHVYLRSIQDTNETLYYHIVINHLEEMMPLIYTPTVGLACQKFSQIYRRKRGLFVSYPDRFRIDEILQNATKQNVKVLVVTDSERVLGLGDQGIGGMGIPIGKLALYTACGGISPAYTLPVVLDVGTNNAELLEDPMYMGWRNRRINREEYDDFVERFIEAVRVRWPHVLLQFEDFAQENATPLLTRYRDRLCCFNDDIQGTAAVTVGTLLAACASKQERLRDQRIVFCGAGSAGCGIAGQIIAQMQKEGLSEPEARQRVFMVDRNGLLLNTSGNLADFQRQLVQPEERIRQWSLRGGSPTRISLLDTIANTRASVLIGVSGQPGLFTAAVVEAMVSRCDRPIILPLSNPTSRAEAAPEDLIRWTDGKAIVATGSPFDPVVHLGTKYQIAQCNNSYVFPGIGLGVLASRATRVTANMLQASSAALAESSPLVKGGGTALLPPLADTRSVSRHIAQRVALQAIEDGVALPMPEPALNASIASNFWEPSYRDYRRTAF